MITSTANDRVRAIRALKRRKERDSRGLTYVEGIRAVLTAIEAGADIETLVVAPDLLTSETARASLTQASNYGAVYFEVAASVFKSISDRDGPQGLGAVVRQRWERLQDVALEDGDRWVAIESIADPGNLGTTIRTADAAGAAGLILLSSSADPYDPTAVRASTGAVFARRLVRSDWSTFATWAREGGATVTGAADDADTSYRGADYGSRSVLLIGSERAGLSAEQREFCDNIVSIPMRGSVDSLNLAVATSLLLYELLNQREAQRSSPRESPAEHQERAGEQPA